MISAAKPDEPASNFQQRDNALATIDGESVLLIASEEITCSCNKIGYRVAIILALYCRM